MLPSRKSDVPPPSMLAMPLVPFGHFLQSETRVTLVVVSEYVPIGQGLHVCASRTRMPCGANYTGPHSRSRERPASAPRVAKQRVHLAELEGHVRWRCTHSLIRHNGRVQDNTVPHIAVRIWRQLHHNFHQPAHGASRNPLWWRGALAMQKKFVGQCPSEHERRGSRGVR